MIPSDVASSLRLLLPEQHSAAAGQTQPVIPAQRIGDVLGGLVPGQRLFAEIQALLPNGTYRAVVAQRDITLALPFSAKAGDSLELEVVESDGKVTLAVVANRTTGQTASGPAESVATTLSPAGKLIGELIGDTTDAGKRAAPAPLNGNQPLVANFPDLAADLAPVLKDALTKSGVFYEAHQARWVAGELPTEALRQEPQGKMPVAMPATVDPNFEANFKDSAKPELASATVQPQAGRQELAPQGGTSIPRELTPIVQQQLDALATQNYAWQGQIWPGQKMWWEISENPDQSPASAEGQATRWQTRLKISLPSLGGIDATLRLTPAGHVDIAMTADSVAGEVRLREEIAAFRTQLEAAGLKLTQLLIDHGTAAE